MSNHYHVVLHVDQSRAKNWTQEEVVERWLQLYHGNLLIHRWIKNKEALAAAELENIDSIIEDWRERLCSISWFMRGVNETALLTCMAYVDLNPESNEQQLTIRIENQEKIK